MSLSCAPDTAKSIDDRVVAVVREQHDKALKILKDNEIKLHQLAKYLYEHETITGEEFMEILQAPVPSVTARSEDGKTEA